MFVKDKVLKLKQTAYTEIHGMVRLENKIRIKKWQRKAIQEGTRKTNETQNRKSEVSIRKMDNV